MGEPGLYKMGLLVLNCSPFTYLKAKLKLLLCKGNFLRHMKENNTNFNIFSTNILKHED